MKKSFVLFAAVLGVSSRLVFAGAYDELTPAQKKLVQSGQQVLKTQDVPGAPWPKVWVYQRVEATPEEAAAVFSDYENQVRYVPSLTYAKISKRIDRATVQVDFAMDVPIVGKEHYTVQEHLSGYDHGSYKVEWTLVRADSSSEAYGSARFEPLGTGTLIAYTNFTHPTSFFAGMFKQKAIETVEQVVQALSGQVTKEKASEPDLLQKEMDALRGAVN